MSRFDFVNDTVTHSIDGMHACYLGDWSMVESCDAAESSKAQSRFVVVLHLLRVFETDTKLSQ